MSGSIKGGFKEQFPSLINEEGKYLRCESFNDKNLFPQDLIEKYCVDKKILKDVIEEFSHTVFSFKPSTLEEAYEQHNVIRDTMIESVTKLKKRLGL